MDILKTSIQWTKEEIFSSSFFILCAIVFLIATVGFWQLGKTEIARAFIYPTLVAGVLLLIVGVGLTLSNKSRLSNFEAAYKRDPAAFVKMELSRTEKTMGEYQNVALKVFPVIIAMAAMLIVFVDKPIWRAISITLIAMLLCMIWIDSMALTRIDAYRKQLEVFQKEGGS